MSHAVERPGSPIGGMAPVQQRQEFLAAPARMSAAGVENGGHDLVDVSLSRGKTS